jgi:hypothetical protein
MKIRKSFTIRLTTITGSVVMLIAYVVFSQAQKTKTIAPGSKFMRVDPPDTAGILASKSISKTNEPPMVQPSSKGSIVPALLAPRPGISSPPTFSKSTPKTPDAKAAKDSTFQMKPANEAKVKNPAKNSTNNITSRKS